MEFSKSDSHLIDTIIYIFLELAIVYRNIAQTLDGPVCN